MLDDATELAARIAVATGRGAAGHHPSRCHRRGREVQKAVDAGATVVMPVEDQFWGDRCGVLQDPFGHQWSMGQPVREVSMEEIRQATQQQ